MGQGNRAADFENGPFELPDADEGKTVQCGFQSGRRFGLRFAEAQALKFGRNFQAGVGDAQAHDGIEDNPAIAANGGLDGAFEAAVRAAGDFGFVAAFQTFKEIGAAHRTVILSPARCMKLKRSFHFF